MTHSQADAILQTLRRQCAGRLTLFLGAAPGVGKTYAMLTRARELLAQGKDVVIGIAETHGRPETQALLAGLPALPRRTLRYQGHALEEMDLDAILERKPAIVLVDELAHRNVPGSRHERRWQDVEEILKAGIDVYSTVNVQHLENLNDVVHQLTGVRVTETIPSGIFSQLRDVRLVDLPVRELIERLSEGKVYLPEQAAKAMTAYFTPSNLTALRELAVQTVADFVDQDLRETRTASGQARIPIARHVLIAIDGLGQSEYLVRAGSRMAERRGSPWSVVTVHSTGSVVDPQRQMEVDRAFSLATQLGGEVEVLHSADVVAAILDHADARGTGAIVIGRTRERPVARMFNRTLTQQLLQRGAHYELTIISAPAAKLRTRRQARANSEASVAGELRWVWASLGAAIALSYVAERFLGLVDLSMIFLVAVFAIGARSRMRVAVVMAVLCFLAYNFFFIEPRFTFRISAQQGVMTVMLFLAAALIAGQLAARLRAQVIALRAANLHAIAMQSLGQALAKAADPGQVVQAANAAFTRAFHADAVVHIGDVTGPPSLTALLTQKDMVAQMWTFEHGQPCGRFTETLAATSWWFLPLSVRGGKPFGTVGVRFPQAQVQLPAQQRRLVLAMVEEIAAVTKRIQLVADLEASRMTVETEQLRSTLLSSVSHDLRSPLASIIGAADGLLRYSPAMADSERSELLQTIRDEGERLDRYIQNLLDMTRLGHQGLTLQRDWIGVNELIGSAATRLRRLHPSQALDIRVPLDLPELYVHPALIEQALFNVMENAAKFAPDDVPVTMTAIANAEEMVIDIADAGPGIPQEQRARIFDMFYSVSQGDRNPHGTGLGLTIVQGIVGAHMGSVVALANPHADQGTLIRIVLPLHPPAAHLPTVVDG